MEPSEIKCSKCSTEIPPGPSCQNGHQICNNCVICPICQSSLAIQPEQTIEKASGSVEKPKSTKKKERKAQTPAPKEKFDCEGAKFSRWRCRWQGAYDEIYEHFRSSHRDNVLPTLLPFLKTRININKSSNIVNVIRPIISQQGITFFYKQKVDVKEKLVYLVIQYVGPKADANKYFYELTATNHSGDVLKIRESCESSAEDVNELINEGKCAVIPFNVIKTYLVAQEITFIFKIELEKPDDDSSSSTTMLQKLCPGRLANFMKNYGLNIEKVILFKDITGIEDEISFQCTITMFFSFDDLHYSNAIFAGRKNGNVEEFILKCRNDCISKNTCFLVQYQGNDQPDKYIYEIIMPFDSMKIFQVSRNCQSSLKADEEINEEKCVLVPFDILNQCLSKDNKIRFALKIREKKNCEDCLEEQINFSSHIDVMEESLKLPSVESAILGRFGISLHELNFSQKELNENLPAIVRLTETCPQLYNPVFFLAEADEDTTMINATIFIKTKLALDKSCAHEKMFCFVKNGEEEDFMISYFYNKETKIMSWLVRNIVEASKPEDYYYEIGIYSKPTQFLKSRKFCRDGKEFENVLIEKGDCVSLPFKTVRRFLNEENEFYCVIRIKEERCSRKLMLLYDDGDD